MTDDPLSKAIEAAGGVEAFRSAAGISPRTLYNWRKHGVPDTEAHRVAVLSRGAVTAAEIGAQRIELLQPKAPVREHGGPRARGAA